MTNRGITAKSPRIPMQWITAAACKGKSIHLFFGKEWEPEPKRKRRETQAKKICHQCPVRTSCLVHAISHPEKAGMWGGMNEAERAAERRKWIRRGWAA